MRGTAGLHSLSTAMRGTVGVGVILIWVGLGCADGTEPQLSELALRGQGVYQNVCIACHNGDPSADGALGPAIAGSSRELLEAKVLRGEYPPGHTPKRPTLSMPPFPYLEKDMPALYAYLNEAR